MHLHAAGLHIHTFWIQNSEILFWTVLLLSDSSAPVASAQVLFDFMYCSISFNNVSLSIFSSDASLIFYEKTEQKKKAQMNLENCRSFRLW